MKLLFPSKLISKKLEQDQQKPLTAMVTLPLLAAFLLLIPPPVVAQVPEQQPLTPEAQQPDEIGTEVVAFRGTFGVKALLFNVFASGSLLVSSSKISFACDRSKSCTFCGKVCRDSETIACSQFASAKVDGSAISQIKSGPLHAYNVRRYVFNAASPADASRAVEAVRRACIGGNRSPVRRPVVIAEGRLNPPSPPTGFYAESRSDFDTLDGVMLNPNKGTLLLFGHHAGSGPLRSVPYLDYLATALESSNPTFSLEWTPESRRAIDRGFNMPDLQLTDNLAHVMEDGKITKRGAWWFRMFGANVQEGMDKMSFWNAVLPAAGYPHAGKMMKEADRYFRSVASGTSEQKIRFDDVPVLETPFEHFIFFAAQLGAGGTDQGTFLHTMTQYLNGAEVSAETWNQARETFWSWIFRGIAIAYKMEENRYVNRYQALERSGVPYGEAAAKTLEMSQDDTIEVQKNAFHALVGSRAFVHITPDVMRDVLGINPVVVPVFDGLPRNSLLAKTAFDADVFGKNLMDMPEIKSDVPGYRTLFELRQTVDRALAAEGHTWFAPDGFELIESLDGWTLRFGKTPIRIYMERYDLSTDGADRRSAEDPLLKQYADELTALYDPLATKFPVLLDLRESMKVMAIAEWLKRKGIKLSLPREGRGTWVPPGQYPGVIHMEIAVGQARVGEVMSASGGVDYRVAQSWKIKQGQADVPCPNAARCIVIACNWGGKLTPITDCQASPPIRPDLKKKYDDLQAQDKQLKNDYNQWDERLQEARRQQARGQGDHSAALVSQISDITNKEAANLDNQRQTELEIKKIEDLSVQWAEEPSKQESQPGQTSPNASPPNQPSSNQSAPNETSVTQGSTDQGSTNQTSLNQTSPNLNPAIVNPAAGQGKANNARAGQTKISSKDGLTYVWIPPGTFMMGCSPGDDECSDLWEKPAHAVTITKGFWIGQTLVTQAAYQSVKGANPSNFKGDQRPVESVTWEEAGSYCATVGMRLPTEAEWEYAARAGSTASRYGDLGSIAWYNDNSGTQTHDVAQKQPNSWKLYDMLGNVWQWTGDWYDENYYKQSPSQDPPGPVTGTLKVLRGGSWERLEWFVRVTSRYRDRPGNRSKADGFRCAGDAMN